jgi:hypothetical protein
MAEKAKINDGGPAFPVPLNPGESLPCGKSADGMNLRDWLAGQAMPAIYTVEMQVFGPQRIRELISGEEPTERDDLDWSENVARDCYRLADAMLRERGRTTK